MQREVLVRCGGGGGGGKAGVEHLLLEVGLELCGASALLAVWRVQLAAVGKEAHHVGAEQVHVRVVARLEALGDGLEVDGKAVGGRTRARVRVLLKGPRGRVRLQLIADAAQLSVQMLAATAAAAAAGLLLFGCCGRGGGGGGGGRELVVADGRAVAGLAHARYALDGYVLDAVAEAGEARIALGELVLASLDELLEHVALLAQHDGEVGVADLGIELARHERGALVVLDVAVVGELGERDVRAEALLLEVAGGELVGVGEKVKDVMFDVVVLQVVHHVRAVALDLLVGRDGAEDDLAEALRGEHVKADGANHPAVLHQHKALVLDKSC